MRCKSRVSVKSSLSKKILSLYIVVLLLVGLSSFYVSAPSLIITVTDPSEENYYTNNTYVNISVNVASSGVNSSFIDWNNSLVGYWNFKYLSGNYVVDNSSYGNNARLENRTTSNLMYGKYGGRSHEH